MGTGPEYVDVIESASPLRYSVCVGEVRPLYSTTTGKDSWLISASAKLAGKISWFPFRLISLRLPKR